MDSHGGSYDAYSGHANDYLPLQLIGKRSKCLQFHYNVICSHLKHFTFVHLQGRRTFRIVHDIMNCCNDSELMQSVLSFRTKSNKQSPSSCFVFSVFFSMKLLGLSLQTKHQRPIATCGLFTFDWTLLFNVGSKWGNIISKINSHFSSFF